MEGKIEHELQKRHIDGFTGTRRVARIMVLSRLFQIIYICYLEGKGAQCTYSPYEPDDHPVIPIGP